MAAPSHERLLAVLKCQTDPRESLEQPVSTPCGRWAHRTKRSSTRLLEGKADAQLKTVKRLLSGALILALEDYPP